MEFKKIISHRSLEAKQHIDFHRVLFLLLLNKEQALQEVTTRTEIDEIKRLIIKYRSQTQSLLEYIEIAQNRIDVVSAYHQEYLDNVKINDNLKIDPSGRKLLATKTRKTAAMFGRGL